MAKLIPADERIVRARKLIEKARKLPVPEGLGKRDLSYIAGVKDLLRQARDMVKFIPMRAGVSDEMKAKVEEVFKEIDQANQEILH
jgi:hypothetical protein